MRLTNLLFRPIMGADTYELKQLNDIWGQWNDGKLSKAQARRLVLQSRWKYHLEKVELLMDFLHLPDPQPEGGK